MSDVPWEEFDSLAEAVDASTVAVALFTGAVDAKLAIEVGYMVLLDKPIIAVMRPGVQMPEKFAKVADEFVEWVDEPEVLSQRIIATAGALADRLNLNKPE